ncbi:putative PHD finger domain protein [Aspergillus homomorphus CBS 101889]|uniref:Chromatin modification-related protein n=1 Tax=Aspergillus homomorphus (strain CBS 101889) TaxID=1450537 RepID=A0A395HLY6_ASPHC|nr:hypothetical protein BO97DRAFT_437415 [Aspergillus homomorphus CBS 101889]RAL08626.1 hypothetical protein BO97DRAFT_437415 [Aspergillus homomorphus CBS 101889]
MFETRSVDNLEDPATVLEQFVHDVANLPAEINHLMEEIQAKDKTIQECRTTINSRDSSLQKFIKLNGSLTPNPKEEQYSKTILQNLDKSQLLQDEKIQLSEKACVLLDRQIKRLDIAIHKLQSNGMLSNDPPLPSLFNNKDQYRDPPRIFFPDATIDAAGAASSSPITAHANGGGGSGTPSSSGNANLILGATQRLNQSLARNATTAAAAAMLSSPSAARSSAPATPSGTVHFHQRHQRESSAGAVETNKRRRLNASLGTLPAASSNLRQSSLGPGTPKGGGGGGGGGGTPASSRAGSAGPRGSGASTTKKALTKKVAPHQQLKKLKAGLNGKHSTASNKRSSSATGRLKLTKKSSPSAASAAAAAGSHAGEDDEDDSLLSSADMSDSEHTGGAGTGSGLGGLGADDDLDDEDEDEGNEDTKVYCTCRSVSHGDMVACDNEDCEFEWFHWKCVGLTREPVGKWYCPQCSAKLGA